MTWIVTCEKNYGVLDYYVECKETGERKGTFDCERWAQEFADELNKQGKGARLERQITERHRTEAVSAVPAGAAGEGHAVRDHVP